MSNKFTPAQRGRRYTLWGARSAGRARPGPKL